MRDPIHVILEYNPSPEFNPEAPNTIHNHIAAINKRGSVLWPKVSKSGRTELHREDVPRINEQIKQGCVGEFGIPANGIILAAGAVSECMRNEKIPTLRAVVRNLVHRAAPRGGGSYSTSG
ncbi:MAG: hypothetical protein V2B18_15675 [Pseudomonadota bacterium]